MYYILERGGLESEIHSRRQAGNELEKKIDRWIESRWGICGFTEMTERYLGTDDSITKGVLCRQVATARVEEIAFQMTVRYLGLQPINFTFEDDIFVDGSHDKRHLIKIPWIKGHSRVGPVIRHERIAPFPANNTPLNKILVGEETLPEYHRRIRAQVFGPNCLQIDASNLLSGFMQMASNKPRHVYEKGVKKKIQKADLASSRPPAEWYYPLYLSLFLSGRMVLFETYDNPEGDVGKIRKHFCQTMDMIKDAIGIYPLVVKIAPLQLHNMCMNRDTLKVGWQEQIVPPLGEKSILETFEDFTRQAISLGKGA